MAASAHVDDYVLRHLPPKDSWPDFVFDRPEYQLPEALNCTDRLLQTHLDEGRGQRPAVGTIVDGHPVFATYEQLAAQVNRIANVLTGPLGLVPGNRVLLHGRNHPMMAALWLACVKAGMVVVATLPGLRAQELKPVIDKARVAVAIAEGPLRSELQTCLDPTGPLFCPTLKQIVSYNEAASNELERLIESASPEFRACPTLATDPCLLAFTSGTTGLPKATVHFHRDVIVMCEAFPRHALKPNEDDVFAGTSSLALMSGLGGLLCFPLAAGAGTLLTERSGAEVLLGLIRLARVTVLFTAPTVYRSMSAQLSEPDHLHDVRSLRKCVSTGESLPISTRQRWRTVTGLDLIDGIGSTEMGHIFIAGAGDDIRPGAIGKVIPGYIAQIVNERLEPVPAGKVGQLAIKGPTGCRYLADPRQRQYVQGGWNLPGDAFCMDEDGYYYHQARTDDLIVSGGYNISGPEVEEVLAGHPAVLEVGVVGVADEDSGQLVKAFVVLRPGRRPSHELARGLQDYVKAHIAPYKTPRLIEFIDRLPRTDSGKLQRYKLRQRDI